LIQAFGRTIYENIFGRVLRAEPSDSLIRKLLLSPVLLRSQLEQPGGIDLKALLRDAGAGARMRLHFGSVRGAFA